jgi:hypothetical protein
MPSCSSYIGTSDNEKLFPSCYNTNIAFTGGVNRKGSV